MNLISKLIEEITDADSRLSSILRKVKVLASDLGNAELRAWADYELNGYPMNPEIIPNYRDFSMGLFANLRGPFGKVIRNYQFPTAFLPDAVKQFCGNFRFNMGVEGIQSILDSNTDTNRIVLPAELGVLIQAQGLLEENIVIDEVWFPFSKNMASQVLDSIRNRLLDFLLDLKEKYPIISESEQAIRDLPKDEVRQVINQYFSGGQNVVATGVNVSQSEISIVNKGDFDALRRAFKSYGLDDNEIYDLETALEEDGPPEEHNKFGPKVATWVGKIGQKALQGAYKLGGAVVINALAQGILQYYGS